MALQLAKFLLEFAIEILSKTTVQRVRHQHLDFSAILWIGDLIYIVVLDSVDLNRHNFAIFGI